MDEHFLTDYIKKSSDFEQICTIYKNNDSGVTCDLVTEIKTDKKYVKKTFTLSDSKTIDYFRREVVLLKEAKLDGFPFLKFYGYNYYENEKSFILSEYVKKGSLEEFINDLFDNEEEEDLSDTSKMKIIYGVAFGLNYLHSRNIIHRDIKLGNIFIDEDMNPYIGDFGFARIFHEGIKTTGNIGTLFYMAPEIINVDSVDPDVSIDTYSFAITVLQILQYNLTLEIDDETRFSIYDIVDRDQFVKWVKEGKRYAEIKNVPDDFKELIADCWDKNPRKRWPMDKVLKKMRERKLFLPNTNADEFFKYVRKLDEAFNRHCQEEKEEKEKVKLSNKN